MGGVSDHLLAVLDNPANVRVNPGSVKTFTAPSPESLAASTTYTVVVEHAGGEGLFRTMAAASKDPDAGSLPGWSFTDVHYRYSTSGSIFNPFPNRPALALFASAKEGLKLETYEIVSQPLDGDTYKTGENIEISYVFNTAVNYVKGGASLMIGATTKEAAYATGTGTNQLLYRYRVQDEDLADTDGVSIPANSLGATTEGAVLTADNAPVTLEHVLKASDSGHKVTSDSTGCKHVVCADVDVAALGLGAHGVAYYYIVGGRGSLSNRLFTHDSTKYAVVELLVRERQNRLEMLLDKAPSDALIASGVLNVGASSFKLAKATVKGERRLVWDDSGLHWRDDISYDTWAVSNVTGGGRYSRDVGLAGGSTDRIYTSFKTGPGSHRLAKVLVFGEVEALVNEEVSTEIFDVRIYADKDGKPGSELIALTQRMPNTRLAVATLGFISTSKKVLEPKTTYWVGVQNTTNSTARLRFQFDGDENDNHTLEGWSIGDNSLHGSAGSVFLNDRPIMMRVYTDPNHIRIGLEAPEPVSNQQAANTPATGAPGITGSARAGETLTADTSGIEDEDGLTDPGFTYQWVRMDPATAAETDIDGETDARYAVTAEDEGKAILVRVAFTDDAGNKESLESNTLAVAPPLVETANAPATGAPAIDGTPRVGETLVAEISGIEDEDGLSNVEASYQWVRHDPATEADEDTGTDIDGAEEETYVVTGDDVGRVLKVRVSFTDDAGNKESLTSEATEVVTGETTILTDRPHGLEALARGGAVVLTWLAPEITREEGGDDYRIMRHRPELGEPDPLVYVDFTSTSDTTFVDTGVEPGVLYVYLVKAVINFFGDLGEASDPVEIRMPADGDGRAARPREQPGHRAARHHRDPGGGPGVDGRHVGHLRRRRLGQRHLQLPVAGRRRTHRRGHRRQVHPGGCRRRQGHQGQGVLHRLCGQR